MPASHSSPVSNDVVMAELRGLSATVEARFDHLASEQKDIKGWMVMLSETMAKQTKITSQFFGLEAQVANNVNMISDMRLDVAALKDESVENKTTGARRQVVTSGLIAALTSGLTAALAVIAPKLFHVH